MLDFISYPYNIYKIQMYPLRKRGELTMKEGIHPKYQECTVTCACGNTFVTGTTKDTDNIKVEICNKCHPYFTGKQKLIDTGGRIERFNAKFNRDKKDNK